MDVCLALRRYTLREILHRHSQQQVWSGIAWLQLQRTIMFFGGSFLPDGGLLQQQPSEIHFLAQEPQEHFVSSRNHSLDGLPISVANHYHWHCQPNCFCFICCHHGRTPEVISCVDNNRTGCPCPSCPQHLDVEGTHATLEQHKRATQGLAALQLQLAAAFDRIGDSNRSCGAIRRASVREE
jgi:hypothetical protein